MENRSIRISAVLVLMIPLFFLSSISEAQRWGGSSTGSSDEALFEGIENEKVLPMLKDLDREHGGPNVPAEDGRFLYDLIMENGYTRGLEIGTSNGYSGLWIGLALKQNGGELVTIEIDPRAAEEARENFATAGLDDIIEVIVSDALEAIPELSGTFDFVFIDAHKPEYYDYFRSIRDRMQENGAITAHNVSGRNRAMANFVEAIQNDPDLETEIFSSHTISVSLVKNE